MPSPALVSSNAQRQHAVDPDRKRPLVTAQNRFRGVTASGAVGPYASQPSRFRGRICCPWGCPKARRCPRPTAPATTVAGACVTILKGPFLRRNALASRPTTAPTLEHLAALDRQITVGSELTKLAANFATWPAATTSPTIGSIRLGEQIACAILEEQAVCSPEDLSMTFASFERAADGSRVQIRSSTPPTTSANASRSGRCHRLRAQRSYPSPPSASPRGGGPCRPPFYGLPDVGGDIGVPAAQGCSTTFTQSSSLCRKVS
jgi:hypothetical protein